MAKFGNDFPQRTPVSMSSRRRDIDKCPPPAILFYGASHVKRLMLWKNDFKNDYCPLWYDRKVLNAGRYVYSGGSKWSDVDDRVRGINVPASQTQGDTWQAALDDVSFNATEVYIMCGSNDIDYTNDILFYKLKNCQYEDIFEQVKFNPSDRYFKNPNMKADLFSFFDPCAYIDARYEEITAHIDRVMAIILEQYSECNLFSLGIINRPNWLPLSVELAKKINLYLQNEHHVKICHLNPYVQRHMLKPDNVHFNEHGYRLFMDRGLGPVLEPHYKLHRIPKYLRVYEWSFTKEGRKRARINLEKTIYAARHAGLKV